NVEKYRQIFPKIYQWAETARRDWELAKRDSLRLEQILADPTRDTTMILLEDKTYALWERFPKFLEKAAREIASAYEQELLNLPANEEEHALPALLVRYAGERYSKGLPDDIKAILHSLHATAMEKRTRRKQMRPPLYDFYDKVRNRRLGEPMPKKPPDL